MKLRSLLNQRFGRLTVIADAGSQRTGKEARHMWRCRCDCGKETVVSAQALSHGQTHSCGCLFSEMVAARNRRHKTHGLSRSRVYHIWNSMHQRCKNPRHASYPRYGGRGIRVCERWNSFENFLADLGQPPDACSTLDRIDSLGHYEPGNCRWATPKQQANNRSSNRRLEYGNQQKTLAEWAEAAGMRPKALGRRLKCGWTIEAALTTPVKPVHAGAQ